YYNYKILLKESLTYEDSKFIVTAWDYYYNKDFEIELSSDEEISDNNTIQMDDNSFYFIRKVASKYLHNRWVDKKTQEGWRYGLLYNKEEKTHPALKEWDNLPSENKKLIDIDKEKAYKFYIEHKNLFT
ncbi:MAG: RyR domain-containing protein, partial [bacterium]